MMRRWQAFSSIFLALSSVAIMPAQKLTAGPPTDSSAQASPIQSAPHARAVDEAMQASPVSLTAGGAGNGPDFSPHTAIPVRLSAAIDSGSLKNGQMVPASLTSAIRSGNITFAQGSPVELSVVETVPAGRISAAGEFSLQLLRVGKADVFTDIQTFRGDTGKKDLPDSAPAVGTDAGLPSGASLVFHVQPHPQAAEGPPSNTESTPGSVNGTASGSPPPAGATPGDATIQSIGNSAVNGLATSPKN